MGVERGRVGRGKADGDGLGRGKLGRRGDRVNPFSQLPATARQRARRCQACPRQGTPRAECPMPHACSPSPSSHSMLAPGCDRGGFQGRLASDHGMPSHLETGGGICAQIPA